MKHKIFSAAIRMLIIGGLVISGSRAFAQPASFDGDKPEVIYDTLYAQEFNPAEGWDRFRFYGQWSTYMSNIFSASDIADG